MSQLSHLDATGCAAAVAAGDVSPRELVQDAIDRIERYDGALNAVVGRRFEAALAEAGSGLPDGPLRGVPTLVKDLGAEVAGIAHTRGSRLFADDVAAHDSELVARYRRAGMVVLGTTNTPEFGKNTSTEPVLHGPTRNPWEPGHSPGGSSGGSAVAVATGMVPVAHGNDGGGSIRIPAAMCGLFGLKPSRGRITNAPFPSTLAGPVGVHHALTTSVRDSALLLDLSAGPLPGEAFSAPLPQSGFLAATRQPPGRLRIGVCTELGGISTDPECVAAVERTAQVCAELGHEVVPDVDLGYEPGQVGAISGVLMGADLVVTVEDRLSALGRDLAEDDLEPFTRVLYDHYRTQSGADVHRALRQAQAIGWQVGSRLADYDVVLTPVLPRPTPELGILDTSRPEAIYELAFLYSVWTSVFNVTGAPAMSVPAGVDAQGLPLGAQFVADLGHEALLFGLAAQLEQAAPWPRHAPGYAG